MASVLASAFPSLADSETKWLLRGLIVAFVAASQISRLHDRLHHKLDDHSRRLQRLETLLREQEFRRKPAD